MFCANCGTKNTDEAAFCSECGKPLAGNERPASSPISTPVQRIEGAKQGAKSEFWIGLGVGLAFILLSILRFRAH